MEGYISPLLANIYLHYVFDLWVDAWRKKCAQGDVIVVRYFNYHAVPGNLDSLGTFRERVTRLWRRSLLARSQTSRVPWIRMHRLAIRWLPEPRVLHPYPEYRFDARYLR